MKSKMKRWKKTIIVLAIMIFLGIAMVIYYLMAIYVADISDISISTSVVLTDTDRTRLNQQENTHWYESADEAFKDTSLVKDNIDYAYYPTDFSSSIMEVKTRNELYMFFISEHQQSEDDKALVIVAFYVQNEKISQPCNIDKQPFKGDAEGEHYYSYDFDDLVAEKITREYCYGYPIKNDKGIRGYYGVGKNKKEVSTLTVNGFSPTNIIPIESAGASYYFWYYDKTDLTEQLESIDYSDFTYQEVIDLLNIQYDKYESK